jgi:general secretion pathway protein K
MRINRRATRQKSANRTSARGSALLMVLWLSAGLAAIGMSIASTVRSETDRVSTSADSLRVSYLANGALERGIQWIQWGNGFRHGNTSMFWDGAKHYYTMAFPSGVAVLEAIPESSKLNINSANSDDLYRVAVTVTGDDVRAREIVDGILDWRSPAQGPTVFDQYYSTVLPTFRARHSSFQEIEELLYVRGVTPEIFYGNYTADDSGRLFSQGGLRDCLSVWGSLGPFDVNTASPTLMQAMGVPHDAAVAAAAQRVLAPIDSTEKLNAFVPPGLRISFNSGSFMYTLRATGRLRRQDGSFSDASRTSAAVVRLFLPNDADPRSPHRLNVLGLQVKVIRSYDEAWSQDVVPPGAGMPPPDGNTVLFSPDAAGGTQ